MARPRGGDLAALQISCETISYTPSSFAYASAAIRSMTSEQGDSPQLAADARQLVASFDCVLMATVGADGIPHASYAPTVSTEDGDFYVYTSGLSRHTANLRANGLVSILFIENESDSIQAFARHRVNFDCRAEAVERDSPSWHDILDRFEARFGKVLDLLRPLSDFGLFSPGTRARHLCMWFWPGVSHRWGSGGDARAHRARTA